MPLPFDATLKDLAQESPRDFLSAFDEPPTAAVTLLNVDLSTVTASADLVFGIGDPVAEVVHVDCQASASGELHRNVLVYNALLHKRYGVPVYSIVVLLRREAQHPNLDGTVRYEPRPGRGKMDFGFEVIRLWERPAAELLTGPLGMLPLALLGRLPEGVPVQQGMPGVVEQLADRVHREATADQARKLLTAAFVLAGLRLERERALELFRGVRAMRESSTYQYILEEGGIEALRRLLLRLGRKRFGEPDDATLVAVTAITDVERLERLGERLLDVNNWQELLQTP